MHTDNIIGIISGMGPHAGLDLARKIIEETAGVERDQDHVPVALLSYPGRIPDRSTWLYDRSQPSPIPPLLDVTRQLDDAGAVVAGMPCNTAHTPVIFNALTEGLRESGHAVRIVHMIRATARHLDERPAGLQRIGVLATKALHEAGLYRNELADAGFEPVTPDQDVIDEIVNPVIFDPAFGIKAHSNPVTDKARRYLIDAIEHLCSKEADAVVLGCTELPLAVPEANLFGMPLVDPTRILARALIRETHPDALR